MQEQQNIFVNGKCPRCGYEDLYPVPTPRAWKTEETVLVECKLGGVGFSDSDFAEDMDRVAFENWKNENIALHKLNGIDPQDTWCRNKFVLVAKLTVETESFPVLWEKYGSLTP